MGIGVGAGLVGGALALRGCVMKKMLSCLFGGGKEKCCKPCEKECKPCQKQCRPSGGCCSAKGNCCSRSAGLGFGMSVKVGVRA
jgi:hypothetical protein